MKTKSRNLIISSLLIIAMLLGVFAMTPLTASAASITPTPEETPAETIYVGGVELSKGQYVKNGETIATTGEPDWEESGFAFYASSGTFHLSDYEYEGTGYTHDISEKSVIYSEGKLEIILHGKVHRKAHLHICRYGRQSHHQPLDRFPRGRCRHPRNSRRLSRNEHLRWCLP